MKIKKLLLVGLSCLLFIDVAMGSNKKDYFQSKAIGNWNSISTWESSGSATGPWVPSTLVPDDKSKGIFIRNGHTVTLDANASAKSLTIDFGGVLVHTNGFSLDIKNNGSVPYEFQINGIYVLYGTMPAYQNGQVQVSVGNTGEVSVLGNASPSESDNFAFDTHVYFNSGLFRWKTVLAFETDGKIYFPNALVTHKARFRIDQNVASVGSNNPTTINSIFEVASGYSITFQNSGIKTFRDGFSGQGSIVQATNSGTFQITSTTGTIDSTIAITLQKTSGNAIQIPTGAVVTMSGIPTITVGTMTYPGAILFIGGTLIHNGSIPVNIANGGLVMTGASSGNKAQLNGVGMFTGSITASVQLTNFATATMYFTPGAINNYLKTLDVGTQGMFTLGNDVNITAGTYASPGTLIVNGTLNANGFVTLKSDAFGTAQLGVSSGTINGNSTVERYIPARKCWRVLSSGPFSDMTESINYAWQDSVSNPISNCAANGGTPGYGTILFNGLNNGASGYDYATAPNPNIKTFNPSGTGFITPSSTTGVALGTYHAYFVFPYGDRQICTSSYPIVATSTTLRTHGVLNTGTVTFTFTGLTTGDYFFVKNPYAATVDLTNVLARSTGVANMVEIWDPNAYGNYGYGAYVTASGNTLIPASGTTTYNTAAKVRTLQSGQAFIMQATGPTATITFMEADKGGVVGFPTAPVRVPAMNISLSSVVSMTGQANYSRALPETSAMISEHADMRDPFADYGIPSETNTPANVVSTANATIIDEVAIRLANESGVLKIGNTSNSSNLFLQEIGGSRKFAIEAKKVERGVDTFAIELNGVSPINYELNFDHQEFFLGYKTTLIDKYLAADTMIVDGSKYQFMVNSDTNSYKHRFLIVINDSRIRKDIRPFVEGIKIYPNPVKNKLYLSGETYTGLASIFDIDGRKVRIIQINASSANVSFLRNGMYILKINNKTVKLIKE